LGQQILAPLLVVNIAMTVLLNLAAFIVLEVARANARLSINSLLTIILKVLAKPMMVATLVALTFAGLGWQLPLVVKSSAQLLGEATSPCALFAIGLALARQRVRLNWEIWFNASYKLILQPLVIFALLAWVFNAQGMKAQTALLAAALPAGTSGVLLAQYYRTYRQQSASTVLLTTLMSMLTLPLFIKLSAYL
jgi:predicted permease